MSSAPLGPDPSLLCGSLTNNFLSRSLATDPIIEGNGGSQRRIRLRGKGKEILTMTPLQPLYCCPLKQVETSPFSNNPFSTVTFKKKTDDLTCESSFKITRAYFDTSLWEFLSPSKVKGEAPVSSSNIRIPRLHQSTDCSGAKRDERKLKEKHDKVPTRAEAGQKQNGLNARCWKLICFNNRQTGNTYLKQKRHRRCACSF